MPVEANFRTDLVCICMEQLSRMGCPLRTKLKDHEVVIRCFAALHRRLAPAPRNVKVARELQYPPTQQGHKGLRLVLEKLERGDDLTPHMSGTIFDPMWNDAVLNEWGLHHFHLGTSRFKPDKRLLKRSNHVLLAYVNDTTAYCVDVRQHKENGIEVWRCAKLMDIIHANWPEVLEPFSLGFRSLYSERFDDRAVLELRASGVTPIYVAPDNSTYGLIGGGSATDTGFGTMYKGKKHLVGGTSLRAVRRAGAALDYARDCQRWLKEHEAEVITLYANNGVPLGVGPRFHLCVVDGKLAPVEVSSGVPIRVPGGQPVDVESG